MSKHVERDDPQYQEKLAAYCQKLIKQVEENAHFIIPIEVAEWVARFASAAYRDGYTRGKVDGIMSALSEMLRSHTEEEEENGIDFSSQFQQYHSGGSGRASGGSPHPADDGGHRVSAGHGDAAGERTEQHHPPANDGVQPTGEGSNSSGPGD